MSPAIQCFLFVVIWMAALSAAAQDPAPAANDKPVDEKTTIAAILAAKEPYHAEEQFRELFRKSTAADLKRLQTHESDLIALQAAWRLVDLTVPEKEPPRVVRPERDQLARFLGFLEGRGRARAPAWWAEGVLDARANRRGNIYAGGYNMGDRREEKPPPAAPREAANFSTEGGKTLLQVGKTTVEVPAELKEKIHFRRDPDKVSALLTPSRSYIAFHEHVGYSYSLVCVERETKKTVWTTTVWASWWGGATGSHQGWVEITEQDDRIVVFGIASTGFHAEAFSAAEGKNLWRFSNAYSN